MLNLTIKEFLEELSSISPITGDYEVNLVTILSYTNALRKNMITLINKTQFNKQELEHFDKMLENSIKKLVEKQNSSKNYINNYMLLMKKSKNTFQEKEEYENSLKDINIARSSDMLYIIDIIRNIVSEYGKTKQTNSIQNDFYISMIKNVSEYMAKDLKNSVSDIDDEEFVFSMLEKLNLFD